MAKYLRRSFRRKRDNSGNANLEEKETLTPTRYWPDKIATLCGTTGFSKKELQLMYRSFKQECPSGLLNETSFKQILGKFFPLGDVTPYAHFVFQAFDVHSKGVINFEELVTGVSNLSRGTVSDKLRWVFRLYDINGDGMISRQELRDVIHAVHRLSPNETIDQMNAAASSKIPQRKVSRWSNVGFSSMPRPSVTDKNQAEDLAAERHADKIFQKLDLNKDGFITWNEFFESCTKDETISNTLALLDLSV